MSKRIKIGALTFHSSYNFGSNLQAYALQKYVLKLADECNEDLEYNIINLRKKEQDNLNDYRNSDKKCQTLVKKILLGKKLEKRQLNYENFINNYLNVTKVYKNRQEIINADIDYDYCITGSDQIWNLATFDFDWSYFLDGIKCKKRISYATSAGPVRRDIKKEDLDKISGLLENYDYISVREEGTKQFISELTNKDVEINVDPTLLLKKEDWNEIIAKDRIIKEPYIFYYSLRPSKKRTELLKKLGKIMNMKVVVANPSIKYDIMGGFIKQYDSGPLEFLNLVKNASLIISSSFHGTVFSVIFNRPFYALNGKNDFRISTLLEKINMKDRFITEDSNPEEISKMALNVNFDYANKQIEQEIENSKEYLRKGLELGE